MTKDEFILLTGEDPEDVFGGDWKNEIEYFLELDVPTYMRDAEDERVADEHIRLEYQLEHRSDPDDPDLPADPSEL